MTLAAQAARQAAADAYRVSAVQSGHAYVEGRRAGEQAASAAEQSRADAAHRAELPVIIGEQAPAAPANELVTVGSAPQATVQNGQKPIEMTGSIQAVPSSDALAALKASGESAIYLQQSWPSASDDLPFGLPVLSQIASHMEAERYQRTMAALELNWSLWPADRADFLKAVSSFGRFVAPQAGDPASLTMPASQQSRGPKPMGEQMTRDAADKKFRELTRRGHDLKARGDLLGARDAFAERDRLAEALFPGSTEPTADNSGHRVG